MADWSRTRVDGSTINNGKEYEKKDRVSRQQLNALVNSCLYTQDFAESLIVEPDVSEAGNVGTPSVSFVNNGKYKKFKFSNIKGEKGERGEKGADGINGVDGVDGEDGNGIINIVKTGTNGLVDTYTINYTNGSTTTFDVKNGKGIVRISKTSTTGLIDNYTITYNDNSTSTFTIKNGDSVEMRVSGGYFQYKRTQDTSWINLIAVSSILAVDQSLSHSSTNPVANNAITKRFMDIENNTTVIQHADGGFKAGANAKGTSGGAVGAGASENGGGGAIGGQAITSGGGAVGAFAESSAGGAVGNVAKAGAGFSGGQLAKVGWTGSYYIDAIQLGTGTNSTVKSLQVYDDNIYETSTHSFKGQGLSLTPSSGGGAYIESKLYFENHGHIYAELTKITGETETKKISFSTDAVNLVPLWEGRTYTNFSFDENISQFKLIILTGYQSDSLTRLIETTIPNNYKASTGDVFLGANGTSNSYQMVVNISGTTCTISSRTSALLTGIYGIY